MKGSSEKGQSRERRLGNIFIVNMIGYSYLMVENVAAITGMEIV